MWDSRSDLLRKICGVFADTGVVVVGVQKGQRLEKETCGFVVEFAVVFVIGAVLDLSWEVVLDRELLEVDVDEEEVEEVEEDEEEEDKLDAETGGVTVVAAAAAVIGVVIAGAVCDWVTLLWVFVFVVAVVVDDEDDEEEDEDEEVVDELGVFVFILMMPLRSRARVFWNQTWTTRFLRRTFFFV